MVDNVFQLLDARLYKEIVKLGFQTPTPIQTLSIQRILEGDSLLLIAPTGHGKTEAAFFPLLHRLLTEGNISEGVHVLWVTPLRALNRDILRRLVVIAKQLEIDVEVPITRMDLVNLAHEEGQVFSVKYYAETINIRAAVPQHIAGKFYK